MRMISCENGEEVRVLVGRSARWGEGFGWVREGLQVKAIGRAQLEEHSHRDHCTMMVAAVSRRTSVFKSWTPVVDRLSGILRGLIRHNLLRNSHRN